MAIAGTSDKVQSRLKRLNGEPLVVFGIGVGFVQSLNLIFSVPRLRLCRGPSRDPTAHSLLFRIVGVRGTNRLYRCNATLFGEQCHERRRVLPGRLERHSLFQVWGAPLPHSVRAGLGLCDLAVWVLDAGSPGVWSVQEDEFFSV